MKIFLKLIRDFILGQISLALMTMFFAIPIILYFFVFAKFTPGWAAGILLIVLIIGFTVAVEKIESYKDEKKINNHSLGTEVDISQFTLEKINESKEKAIEWSVRSYEKLEILRHSMTDVEYLKKKELINKKLYDRMELLDNVHKNRSYRLSLLIYSIFSVLVIFFLWMQPWESPSKKLSDEWRRCNNKYNNQCSYISDKYKTNIFEMSISETLHGKNEDIECYRSRHSRHC